MPATDTNTRGATGDSPADRADGIPGVLVVDDDPGVRGFVRVTLTRAGYRVFDADNMADALDLFRRVGRDVRVALLDVSMPGGSGPEVLRELRRLRPDIPGVFMSGELDSELTNDLASRLRREGADGLLPKPVGAAAVVAALAAAGRSDTTPPRSTGPRERPEPGPRGDTE